jgi:hypothetical protein
MKDYKQLYLKTFFFWQEAYAKLEAKNKQLIEKIEHLELEILKYQQLENNK